MPTWKKAHLVYILKAMSERTKGVFCDELTAGPSPRWIPLSPSFRQVFTNASNTLLYTLMPPSFASSPCSCIRVLATSGMLEKVTCARA